MIMSPPTTYTVTVYSWLLISQHFYTLMFILLKIRRLDVFFRKLIINVFYFIFTIFVFSSVIVCLRPCQLSRRSPPRLVIKIENLTKLLTIAIKGACYTILSISMQLLCHFQSISKSLEGLLTGIKNCQLEDIVRSEAYCCCDVLLQLVKLRKWFANKKQKI